MYRKALITVILVILILGFSGNIVRPNVEQPTVWKLQPPWYIITSKTSPRGLHLFRKTIEESLGERGGILGGYSGHYLVKQAEPDLGCIKECNIIFLIVPKVGGFKTLQELWIKYPELFPLPYSELNKLSSRISPLIYLAYDIQAEKLRGVIVADKVDSSLAKLLAEEELPLNVPLRYKKGRLKEIKEK